MIDRIMAVVNGQVVMLSEVRLMQSLQSAPLPFETALNRVIREKLRLQDIAKFTVYPLTDEDVLEVLAASNLSDTPEHRGAVRRALIVRRYIQERFEPLVAVSDAQVADFLNREYPVHSIRPGSPDWEMARRAAGEETLNTLVEEWDRRLWETAAIEIKAGESDQPNRPLDPSPRRRVSQVDRPNRTLNLKKSENL